MAPAPTPALLLQMIQQIDEKHDAGHIRLRQDLTEGLNSVNDALEQLRTRQRSDHDELVASRAYRERRKDLSSVRAVMIAAAIGGGFRLIEVILMQVVAVLRGHL